MSRKQSSATRQSPVRRVLIKCETLEQYVACSLDRQQLQSSSTRICPLLLCGDEVPGRFQLPEFDEMMSFTTSRSFPELEGRDARSLVDICADAVHAAEGQRSVCLVDATDDLAIPAAVFALLNGRGLRVVNNTQELASSLGDNGSATSILLFASAQRLSDLGLDFLRDTLSRGPASIPWGIATGSLAEISAWIARSQFRLPPPRPEMKFCWFFDTPLPKFPHQEGLELYESGNLAGPMSSQHSSFVVFSGHGRSYCSMEGNLCSKEDPTGKDDESCIDGMECVLRHLYPDWQRISASHLRCDFVVMDSCYGAGVGVDVQGVECLATRLLAGRSIGVLATYRSSPVTPLNCLLIWELLQQACSMGQLAQRLNGQAHREFRVLEPYVLFGDPETVPFGHDAILPMNVDAVLESEGVWSLRLPAPQHANAIYRCADPNLVARARLGTMSVTMPLKYAKQAMVQLAPWRGIEELDILVSWLADRPAETIQVQLGSKIPVSRDFLESIDRTLKCAEDVGLIGPSSRMLRQPQDSSSSTDNPAAQMIERLAGLEPILASRGNRSASPAFFAVMTELDRVLSGLFERTNQAILERLGQSRAPLYATFSQYVGAENIDEIHLPLPCPRCGGSVQRKEYRTRVWDSQRRWVYECERCTTLADIPVGATLPELVATATMHRGTTTRFDLELVNHHDHEAVVRCLLMVEKSPRMPGQFEVQPKTAVASAAPGQKMTLSFTVRPDHAVPLHVYRAVAFFMIAQELCSVQTMVGLATPR